LPELSGTGGTPLAITGPILRCIGGARDRTTWSQRRQRRLSSIGRAERRGYDAQSGRRASRRTSKSVASVTAITVRTPQGRSRAGWSVPYHCRCREPLRSRRLPLLPAAPGPTLQRAQPKRRFECRLVHWRQAAAQRSAC
jgi:hypothetical protein